MIAQLNFTIVQFVIQLALNVAFSFLVSTDEERVADVILQHSEMRLWKLNKTLSRTFNLNTDML